MRRLLLLTAILIAPAAFAQLYECTDTDGNVSFQDTPCAAQQREQNLDESALRARINLAGESPVAVQPAPKVINLVYNGSFQQGIDGWTAAKDPAFFQWATIAGTAESGALSVQSAPPENPKKRYVYSAEISQCVKLGNGRRYRLSARYQPVGYFKSRSTNRVNISWYQSEDCTTGGAFASYLEPEPAIRGWQQLSQDRLLRNLNAKAAKITVAQARIPADGQQALWDDIALVPVEFEQPAASAPGYSPRFTRPLGANYVFNGDFSRQLDGWSTSGDTRWQSGEGRGYTGGARIAITSKKGGYGAHRFSQCINIGADRRFTAGAEVKVDARSNQKGGGIFRVSWYEGQNCQGRRQSDHAQDRVEDLEGWQTLTIPRLEAPPQAQSINVQLTRGVEDTGTFAFYVDNIYLKSTP